MNYTKKKKVVRNKTQKGGVKYGRKMKSTASKSAHPTPAKLYPTHKAPKSSHSIAAVYAQPMSRRSLRALPVISESSRKSLSVRSVVNIEETCKKLLLSDWKGQSWSDVSKYVSKDLSKHPVLSYLMEKGMNLSQASEFYDYGNTRFNTPESDHIIAMLTIFKSVNKTLSYMIKELDRDYYKKGNVLQPQMWQLFILHYFLNDSRYNKMKSLQSTGMDENEKWKLFLELFGKNGSFINVFELGSGHDKDLEDRAKMIGKRIFEDASIKMLKTMDGHGRFLSSILQYLFDKDPNFIRNRGFTIRVYDIDPEVNLWHQTTLPSGATVEKSIFEGIDESISSTLVYLNFSGLVGQANTIFDTVEKYSKQNYLSHLFVSFSTVRGAVIHAANLSRRLNNIPLFKILTLRTDFLTYGTKS